MGTDTKPAERSANPQCQKCGLVIKAGETVQPVGTRDLEHVSCPRCFEPHPTEPDVTCGLNANFHTNAGHPFVAAPAPSTVTDTLDRLERALAGPLDIADRIVEAFVHPSDEWLRAHYLGDPSTQAVDDRKSYSRSRSRASFDIKYPDDWDDLDSDDDADRINVQQTHVTRVMADAKVEFVASLIDAEAPVVTALPALLALARAADLANRRLDMYLPDAEAGLPGEAHDDVSTAQRYLSESLAAVAALEVGE